MHLLASRPSRSLNLLVCRPTLLWYIAHAGEAAPVKAKAAVVKIEAEPATAGAAAAGQGAAAVRAEAAIAESQAAASSAKAGAGHVEVRAAKQKAATAIATAAIGKKAVARLGRRSDAAERVRVRRTVTARKRRPPRLPGGRQVCFCLHAMMRPST